MSTSPIRVSVICVISPNGRAHAHALAAEYAHNTSIELILVDHGDTSRPAFEAAGATIVRSAALGVPAAFAAGVDAASGTYIAFRHPDTVGLPGALTAAADALDAAPGAWLSSGSYQLVGAGGAVVHAIDPEQDADSPPPGFESGLVFRRAAAAGLSRAVGEPIFIAAMAKARLEGAVIYGGAAFQMPFDRFALDRFDHRRDLHVHSLRDSAYDAPKPWMSVVICAGSLEGSRETIERLCTQVMPRRSFEIVVADRSGSGELADEIGSADSLAPMRAVRAAGASRGAALNAAVAAAEGDALLLLAEDATPFPDLVEQHARAQRSMAPREVIVLGTWETPAAELPSTLARVLDATDLVPGRGGLVGGQFHDGDKLHSANISMPTDVFRRSGGFDEGLADAHLDHDLGIRLAELGYRPYYHEAARVLRGAGMGLEELRAHRIASARGLVDFWRKHPEVLEGTSMANSTVAELSATIEENGATVAPVSAAAAALAELSVGPLEQVGNDWREFADGCVERLETLLRHLDVLWRADGLREGLETAGLDGMPALLASAPREVPGARKERHLIVPHEQSEETWLVRVARYMSGFSRDEDVSLVVLADDNAGAPPRVIRDVCNLLSSTLRPAPGGAWPHVLIVDRGTLGGGMLRLMAGMTGWVGTGGPEDEKLREMARQAGVPEVDTGAWEGRAYGGTAPANLRTRSPIRVLAWPNWADPAEMTLLMEIAGAALTNRPDATLCLRWDASDGEPEPALTALAEAYEASIGQDQTLDVLLVEQALAPEDLPALGLAADAFISLPSSATGARAGFAEALGAHTVSTSAALQERVLAVAARNPGPLVPGQVYVS